MALWAVAFMGSTPVGGPLIGWVIAVSNARLGLGVGGLSCLIAAGLGFLAIARRPSLGSRVQLADVQYAEKPGGSSARPDRASRAVSP